MNERLRMLAHRMAELVGSSRAFSTAVLVVVVWAALGPLFHFSDGWRETMQTGAAIGALLVVLLIQNTQNRDAHALHSRVDELMKASKQAKSRLLTLDQMSDEELVKLQREFEELRDRVIEARKTMGAKRATFPTAKEKIN